MYYKKPELAKPQFISTILVQEIVGILKQPPFNETLTLMSFDEKKEYELLELIVKALGMIDDELKVEKSDTSEIFKILLEFLRVVNFPYLGEKQLEEDLMRGDKKLLVQILHFLLTKIADLRKRYYLSKFLNNILVGDEFSADEELIELMTKYRTLQAEFQTIYSMVEERRQICPQTKELQEDIEKLKSDKLQLTSSINRFKKEYGSKKDFQELFEVTSKLRKEQEEDSNLEKRLIKQQYDLEDLDDRVLISKQRLMDSKKNLADNISAFELLESLRNQRNANRDSFENLSKYELVDKRSKLKSLEEILMLPEISFEDLSKLKKDRLNLQNEIEKLENKVKNSASKSSELTIYKQNAMQAASNKESSVKILDKLEKEKILLDHKITEMDKKYEQSKGFKYVRKDDIIQQAENVKKKKEIFVKFNKILDILKGDTLILDRTVSILRTKTSEGDSIIKKLEEKHGNSMNQAKKELEELSRKKQEIDLSKALTLEEYSKLIQQIRSKIQQTQDKHAPLIEEHSKIKQEYEQLTPIYNQKKQIYDSGVAESQTLYNKVKEEYTKLETPLKDSQNKFHQLNIQIKLAEAMTKRYEAEKTFLTSKDKKLNDNYKSNTEYYKKIITEQENFLVDLKEKQKRIKDTYENNNKQLTLYADLKKILIVKKQTLLNTK